MSFELPTIQSFEKEASSSLLQIDELLAVCLGSTLGAVTEPLDTAKPVHMVIQELENCRKQLTFSVSEANSLITQLQSKRDAKLGDLRNIVSTSHFPISNYDHLNTGTFGVYTALSCSEAFKASRQRGIFEISRMYHCSRSCCRAETDGNRYSAKCEKAGSA